MHPQASTLQPVRLSLKLTHLILHLLAIAAALPLLAQQRPEMVTQGGGGMEGFMGQHAPVFGPQGRWVAAIGGKGALLVFDRASGRLARSIDTGISITSLSAHPAQDEIILTGDDKENSPVVAVYNVITGKPVWKASGVDSCFQVRFSPSGAEALAFCSTLPYSNSPSTGKTLRWSAADGAVLLPSSYHSQGWSINTVSENGEISSSINPNAANRADKLMKAAARRQRRSIFSAGNREKEQQDLAEAEDEVKKEASSMDNMTSTFLDASSGNALGSATGMVLAISAKSRTAVIADGTGLVLIDIANGKPILLLGKYFQQDPATGYLSAAVSPDGSRFLLAGAVHVTVIDSATGQTERDISSDIPFAMKWAISPDNNELAAAQGNAVMVFNLAGQTHQILGDPSTVMMPGSVMAKSMAQDLKGNTATQRLQERKLQEDQYAKVLGKAHGSSRKEMQKQSDDLARKDAADQPRANQEAQTKQDTMNSMVQYMGTMGAVTGFPPAERFLDHARLLAVRTADGGWGVWDTATGNPLPYRKPLGDLSRYEHAGSNPEDFLDDGDLRAIEENLGIRPRGSAPAKNLNPDPAADVACSSPGGDHWVEINRNGKKLSGALLKSGDGTTVDLLAKGVDLSSFNPHGLFQSAFMEASRSLPERPRRKANGTAANQAALCSLSPAGDRLVVEVERPEAKPGRKAKIDALHMGMAGGAYFAHSFSDSLVLYNVADGRRLCELENPLKPAPFDLSAGELVFSSDSKRIAAGGKRQMLGKTDEHRALHIWDGETCRQIRSIENADSATPLGFSDDYTLLFTGITVPAEYGSEAAYGVHVWNASTGEHLFDLPDAAAATSLVVLGPRGKTLLAPDRSNALGIWSAADGSRLGMLRALPQGEWLVTAQSGLFDGSPRGWSQIAWRDPDGLKTEPAEVFFTDFYRPGLFAELLDGHQPALPRNLAQVDRRQPTVVLSASSPSTAERTVQLEINATEASTGAPGGGVRDLRLFRNGVLIKAWRGDLPVKQGKTTLQVVEPVVAGANHFTAYAFNHDNVKSADAETVVQGTAARRPGTVFLLAVGVNQYSNNEFNLRYAAPDATRMGDALEKSQQKAGRYPEVVRVDLLDSQATKANILFALNRLAGQSQGKLLPNAPPALAKLRVVQPEDSVMIYFAGHGIAWQDHFYLVPHDLGYTGSRSNLADGIDAVLQHSISDVELESSLEPLDASHILLVIDACNSGKALDAEEQRRGPMNTRGLAQLAYEKGIDVLTASQSYQAALESSRLGHGYLTYALAEEGLTLADTTPVDGKVTAPEWFEFASSRVPQLQIRALEEGSTSGRQLTFEADPSVGAGKTASRLQTPRFYYRRGALNMENIIAILPEQH